MVFKRSGDERLSLVLRGNYPFLSEEDLKSPFSDIPTFLSTDVDDENYCDYSKLEDLNTPTPLDSIEPHFDYEYLNPNEIKMEESYPNQMNIEEMPARQTKSVDETRNFVLLESIKSEYVDEPSSDYPYYIESQEATRSEPTYPISSYTTDHCQPHELPACHHDINPVMTHQPFQPVPHLQPKPEPHIETYQPNYYQPCYIETPCYPSMSYTTHTSPSSHLSYHNLSAVNNSGINKWDPCIPMYSSPDSGVCITSPPTQPSPYAPSSSSYSTRSDIGDLDSDILRLTTSTTHLATSNPSNCTISFPRSVEQPVPSHSKLIRQVSAPLDGPIKISQSRPRVKIADSQKPFLCGMSDCPKRFVRIDELKRHQRTHSGVKQFVCEDCQKGFTRSDHLTTHRRTHTGERPYPCSICDRRFARSDEKNRHEKTHSKEKSRAGRKPKEFKKFEMGAVGMAHSF